MFAQEIEELLKKIKPAQYQFDGLGVNSEAFKFVKDQYANTIKPLIESYREDPGTKDEMDRIVPRNTFQNSPGLLFRRRVSDLEKQRPLSKIERDYYRSTENLTAFSPYLVGAARADFGTTSVYLQNHFEMLSNQTQNNILEGAKYPLVLLGTGPNGIIAAGEIVRKNPRLAAYMLVIDQGSQPGGPFAIPNGPAWELNSANLVGKKTLPDLLELEEKRVRAYGSSDRWYPGERTQVNDDTRSGSINKLVDWLADPDDLSLKRYPTNEELYVMLNLHAAHIIKNLALNTKLLSVRPFEYSDGNNKELTLAINLKGQRQLVTLPNRRLIISSGLGEKNYGFPLRGKKAAKVLTECINQTGLPKFSTTLEAFNALADRATERPTEGLGEVIVIYGVGNSADTLVEYLGRIFDSENSDIRKIQKIYVIATGAPTRRPRYRKIDDLRPRLGRGNLISLISARVGDVGFENERIPLEGRKMILFDRNNRVIKDEDNQVIRADNVIAATGFTPDLDEIFSPYLKPGETIKSKVAPFTLPTNSAVSVADVFTPDRSILFVGTSSNPRFNDEKLSQLPASSKDALIRVGPENAVAIGFRGPDTQAALNIYLSTQDFADIDQEVTIKKEKDSYDIGRQSIESTNTYSFPATISTKKLRIQQNADENRFLSALTCYLLKDISTKRDGIDFSGTLQFQLTFDTEIKTFKLQPIVDVENPDAPTEKFITTLIDRFKNEYFQRYSLSLLRRTRGSKPLLNLNISFKKGQLDTKNTFIP